MALHYLLSFVILLMEVVFFFVLIAPLPFTARRKLFQFLASPPARRVQYWFKITFIFVAVLFVDACQKMAAAAAHLAQLEQSESASEGGIGQAAAMASAAAVAGASGNAGALASKFYTERNFYLTGFTLLLGLIHSRVFRLITELIETQEELYTLESKQGSSPSASGAAATGAPATESDAAAVEAKYVQQIATLKKQTEQQQIEYNRLSDELAKATGSVSSKRAD